MKETIYTIPISEVFEPCDGCPMCVLFRTLEDRWVDYVTGAAMMEPDVRVETNRHGFCSKHFDMMLAKRNRLSVALILQSRLDWADEDLDKPPKAPRGINRVPADKGDNTCFLCMTIESELKRILLNITKVWSKEQDFRDLYRRQEFLCHPHALRLLEVGYSSLKGSASKEFAAETAELTRKRLREAKANIDAFCNLFDYRNAHSRPGAEVSAAVESAIEYLTGFKPGLFGEEEK